MACMHDGSEVIIRLYDSVIAMSSVEEELVGDKWSVTTMGWTENGVPWVLKLVAVPSTIMQCIYGSVETLYPIMVAFLGASAG
ncbi:hypothetical protein BS47DRAFT_158197 [Hydnum rufescens UP504]|uniref:Uncharacterized protein n=1 Tax=Hydnum rufescens UP504 TaxID=1448309 RepID=A0A9P6ANW7_9AGAM|nr:hypothetical protein BS47DRAFT_158197 [Hydnum rufescens UP504]